MARVSFKSVSPRGFTPCFIADTIVSFLCPSHLDFVQFPQLFQRNFQSVRAGAFAVKLLLWLRVTRLQPVAETLLLISRLPDFIKRLFGPSKARAWAAHKTSDTRRTER
jgi:hypothetical protein